MLYYTSPNEECTAVDQKKSDLFSPVQILPPMILSESLNENKIKFPTAGFWQLWQLIYLTNLLKFSSAMIKYRRTLRLSNHFSRPAFASTWILIIFMPFFPPQVISIWIDLKQRAHSFLKSFVAAVVSLTEVREKLKQFYFKILGKKKEENSSMWKVGMLKFVRGKTIGHFFKPYSDPTGNCADCSMNIQCPHTYTHYRDLLVFTLYSVLLQASTHS